MDYLRRLTAIGHAVLCVSATKRDKDGQHNDASLGLSSFRESGEIEYGADSAYVLVKNNNQPKAANGHREMILKHVKNRHAEQSDIELLFDKGNCSFVGGSMLESYRADDAILRASINELMGADGDGDTDNEEDDSGGLITPRKPKPPKRPRSLPKRNKGE
jgi:hypothetical protein